MAIKALLERIGSEKSSTVNALLTNVVQAARTLLYLNVCAVPLPESGSGARVKERERVTRTHTNFKQLVNTRHFIVYFCLVSLVLVSCLLYKIQLIFYNLIIINGIKYICIYIYICSIQKNNMDVCCGTTFKKALYTYIFFSS